MLANLPDRDKITGKAHDGRGLEFIREIPAYNTKVAIVTEAIEPGVILLFGTNGTGKSTTGSRLADMMDNCVHIEVDELREPAGSEARHDLSPTSRRENAVALATTIAVENAFRRQCSVVEGLSRSCRPGNGWSDRELPGLRVFSVCLLCNELQLRARWQARGWGDSLPEEVRVSLKWYRQNSGTFDLVLDTSRLTHDECAYRIEQKVVKLWRA